MDDKININFDRQTGLVPVVAQDIDSGEILMVAYADKEALSLTLNTGFAHYYSRSRKSIWKKGASSGHIQQIVDVRVDCDEDSLVYRVKQTGGACHTGYYSCFYRRLDENGLHMDGKKVFNPKKVYKES